MKKREGFVSNSSSASFVIHWRYRSFGEKKSKEEVLKNLRGWVGWDNEKQEEKIDEEFMSELMKNTIDYEDGTFTTNFFTTMLNSHQDFGPTAAKFCMSLLADERFVIIDKKLDEEDGWR